MLVLVLVRKRGKTFEGRVFGRRSRWAISHAGLIPGLTRKPPGAE